MTKAKTKPPAEEAERTPTQAEAQRIVGRNAGKSGALFHTALAARLLSSFAPDGKLSKQDVCDGLKEASNALVKGETETVERMLYAQMTTLNGVFAQCVSRALQNMGQYLDATETYMRLGLKAQAQCARTAEVLGNLRAGPAIFAKQANIAQGHQQVNNGPMPQAGPAPHAQETSKPRNELLEDGRHEQQGMVPGAQTATARSDTTMEAVEEIHRTKDKCR